ncbi:serine protease, partial [Methylobacterium sp. E-065]|uniref:S1C family serine protease n=1 Tax=Methylobacterium sp. E-065 TaxID=2836583 RepID=UPI0028BED9F4
YELLSSDNSFLYAFGPYASANPPAQIHWLRAGRLEDVTRHANFAGYQRQRLAGMEHAASLDPERWHDNNFLGGWVAQSILVGRGEAAWTRMLQLYDRNDEWPYEECTVALPLAKCPDARKRKIDFPSALRRHLNEGGYATPWLAPLTVAPPTITVLAGPARYEVAAAAFQALPIDQRIRLQVLLTATGQQVAVPNVDFSKRLFETVMRYQSQSGLPVSGVIDEEQAAGLMREATPLLRTWGFRTASHPSRGRTIWVPFGLGLREERTGSGSTWTDPAKRVTLSYIATPSALEDGYRAALERLTGDGARINYKVLRPDFFAISASGTDGLDWYMRFHRDGGGTLGFFLAWKTAETDLHMERVAVLVSGSLAASMSGTPFTAPITVAPPPPAVAVATPSPPLVPTPPAIAPGPPDSKPHTASSGTGFFVSRAGHLLTNAHVVQNCSAIEVNGPNGLVAARLVAQDRTNDLALLKAEITPVKIAALRTGVRLGEAVAVFGYPLSGMLSTSGNFTLGNVTALTGLADDSRYFQISAPVQPGNSGGPLVDASGNLIGVVSAKLNALKVMVATNGDIPQNVNFAIKGSLSAAFLESNGVAYATGTDTAALPPADLAEHAKSLSAFVACR